ncbi:glucose-6-phosphate isomerase [candidate division KSB3 bacterium]|uniref:Glucose-6-phosphate isomerase n=1 Tax=candidate division KSB3 bacterium TaxID=2044937 RepID=A0A2G6E9X8_9BACT|nr:MAG: glucose-6-phosphate isomerase [candidate division KSB3 bacterium]PIE29519.1 MAG: glucose-6-phosphate isomerase [candidate division KSB3 bacterium]
MKSIVLDYTHLAELLSEEALTDIQAEVTQAFQAVLQKSGPGNDFLGWVDLPHQIKETLVQDIQECADGLRAKSDRIISVGIGGSYLGAKAVIEALKGPFGDRVDGSVPLLFAGQNISSWYMKDLLALLDGKDFSVVVISKSGTTTEPGLAFRILKDALEKKYGKRGARTRIVAITDKSRGALKQLADDEGYKSYVIPDDVGGRFSVLTPVGLLPIACAGLDIQDFVNGFRSMAMMLKEEENLRSNPALAYAAMRTLLYRQGKKIEVLVNFEPALHYISEWWKQLFGESEGKDGKGLFPASADFTTDLHSMGQLIQDGERSLFESFLIVGKNHHELCVPHDDGNLDGLNYLEGKNLDAINFSACQGTALAHRDGGVPSMTIELPELTPYYLGQLLYFYEIAVAVSGYLLQVNPFDQPGVEAYKSNMFALLGKPGLEAEHAAITARISTMLPKRIVV